MALAVKDANSGTVTFATATDAGGNTLGVSVPCADDAVGGAAAFWNDAVAGTKVEVKSSQGQIYAVNLVNTTAAAAYLQVFFLPASGVTVGTTTPDFCIRLLASATMQLTFPTGLGKSTGTGITLAGTTTATGSTGAAISVLAAYL